MEEAAEFETEPTTPAAAYPSLFYCGEKIILFEK